MIREHIYNHWLRLVVVLLVMMTGSLTAAAQYDIEGGEAFYIYQNDGHFDGFFYDQVQQISYSRLDTLGVEYDEYVSQEIVTADSTYRIMLTAIDSVSFVQPEIRYAKGVRFMRDEGMMDYFNKYFYDESEKHVLNFNLSMPESLRPKMGDVLSCDDVPGYEEGSFTYKVVDVRQGNDYLQVWCEHVTDLRDVFEQFITVEQVRNIQTPEGSRTRCRVAGWKSNTRTRIEGNIDEFTLFNINTGFELSTNIYGNLSFVAAFNINFGMTISSVYNISLTNWYFKHEMKEQIGLGANLGLNGNLYEAVSPSLLLGGTALANFTRIPIPTVGVPLFWVAAMPEPFASIEANLTLMFNTGFKAIGLAQCIESMETFPYVNFRYWTLPGFLPIPVEWEGNKSWSINAQLNGTVQAGIRFPVAIGSQEWFNKIFGFKTAMYFNAGPKVSGALDLTLVTNDSNKGLLSMQYPKGWYEKLKGTKVDLSLFSVDPDFNVDVKTIGGVKWDFKRTTSFSFGNYTLHLFPEIKGFNCEISGDKMNTITAKANEIKGEVFMPQRIGVVLYKVKDENDKENGELYRSLTRDEIYFLNTFNNFELKMENVPPGIYMAYPMADLPFGIFPIEPLGQFITIAPQEMELKQTEIVAEEEGGVFEIDIIASLDMPISCESNDDWIKAEVLRDVGGAKATILKITVDPNKTYRFRTGTITVRQRFSTTETIERTVTVKQFGGLQLEPSSLSFGMEGGSQSVEILTSMWPISINLNNAGWLKYELTDKHLVITAYPNPGDFRTANVTVSALSNDGFNAKTLIVEQAANTDPSVAHVSPTSLEFDAEGGTKDVKVYFGQYTRSGYAVSNEGKDWVTVMNDGEGTLGIRVKPNTTGAERTCTVTCYLTSSTSDRPSADEMEAFPITIKQAANALEPGQIAMQSIGSFTFTAAAMMKDRKTGGTSRKEFRETFSSPNISFTQKGTTVHVQATKNYKDGYDTFQNLIEFDITNFGDNFVKAKIENLSFRHIYNDTYIDFTSPGVYGKSDDVEIELTGIYWQGSLSNYEDGQQSEFVFDGDVKTGVSFKKMTETKLYYSEDNPKQNFDYVDSNDNSASLALQFTAKGESLSRKQTRQTDGSVSEDIIW